MNPFSEKQESVRKYLLGTLDDEIELRQIEESIMLSDEFEDQISIAEDELIEEYLDGELSAQEAENFKAFFLASPQRKEKFGFVNNLRRYSAEHKKQTDVPTEEKSQGGFFSLFLSPAFLRFAVIAVLISGIGFIVWKTVFYESDVDKGLARMREVYKGARLNESRSSFDSAYAPFVVTRGSTSTADSEKLEHVELILRNAAQNSSDAQDHHALGVFYFNKRDFDKALNSFIAAQKLSPDDAQINSDIGATYLEKAGQNEEEEKGNEALKNLSLSLEAIDRALRINPNLPEALFNKGLVLKKMRVPEQAIKAWQKYLEIDSTSEWADEARKNLENLQKIREQRKDKTQILEDFLNAYRNRVDKRAWQIVSETKEFVTGSMVQTLLSERILQDKNERRNDYTNEIVSAFSYLGQLEEKKAGEKYFSDLAEYYKNISPKQKALLSDAYVEMQKAQLLLFIPKIKDAIESFNKSKELFLSAGNIWEAQLIEYQICYCLGSLNRIDESDGRLTELKKFGEEKNYKWLQVLSENWLGANLHSSGETFKGTIYNQKALELSRETDDIYNIQRNLIQLSEEYKSLENTEKSFAYIFEGLTYPLSYHRAARQDWRLLIFTSQILYSFKYYEAASVYAEEELSIAENDLEGVLQDNWMRHSGLVRSGIISASLKNFDKAVARLSESLKLAESFSDEEMRQRLTSRSLTALGNVQRQNGNCADAVNHFNRAIEIFERMPSFTVGYYEARRGRLLCFIEQNDKEAVNREMPEILKIFEKNRKQITDETARNIFFDNEQDIYDIAADYAFTNLQDQKSAFYYAENSRARSLLSLIKKETGDEALPLSLEEIQKQVPSKVQLLYFTVLKDKVIQWHITGNAVNVKKIDVSGEELENQVQNYSKLLVSGKDDESLLKSSEKLYSLLIEPAKEFLDKDKTLCIIADKQLLRVPFSSLVAPADKKYLIEDFQIQSAPSATVFLKVTKIAQQKHPASEEVLLSVGNPKFSRADYGQLKDLPAAAREAEEIRKHYTKDSKVFINEKASKNDFVTNLQNSDVVHFAGHYVANAKTPAHSKFLLANGELSIEEISSIKLPRTRLMILSACDTGIENYYNGEGMIGAARSFLAADVPIVIASAWSVDSEATSELMTKFHQYRKSNGLTVTAALRQSQLDLLKDESNPFRQPFFWAGFLPIGGFVEY